MNRWKLCSTYIKFPLFFKKLLTGFIEALKSFSDVLAMLSSQVHQQILVLEPLRVTLAGDFGWKKMISNALRQLGSRFTFILFCFYKIKSTFSDR